VLTSVAYFVHEKTRTVSPNFSSYLCSEKSLFGKYFRYLSENHTSASPPETVMFSLCMPRRRMGCREILRYNSTHLAPNGGKWSTSCPSRPPPPRWEKPRYPLNRRLGGPQGRSGTFRIMIISLALSSFSNILEMWNQFRALPV
jgi:hypothetical protein